MKDSKNLKILFFDKALISKFSNELKGSCYKILEINQETKKEIINSQFNIGIFNLDNEKEREILKEIKNIKNINLFKIGIKNNTSIKNIEDYSLGLDKIQSQDSLSIKDEITSYKKTFLMNYELNCSYLTLVKEIDDSKIYLKKELIKKNKEVIISSSNNPSIAIGKYYLDKDDQGWFLSDEFRGTNIVRFGMNNKDNHIKSINKKVLIYSNKGYSGRLPYSSIEVFSSIDLLMQRMKDDFSICYFEYTNDNKTHQKNLAWKMKESFGDKKFIFFNAKNNYGFNFTFYKKNLTEYIKEKFSGKKFIEDGIVRISSKIIINSISLTEATISTNDISLTKGDFIEINDPFYLLLKVNSCKNYNNFIKYNCVIEGMDLESRKKILKIVEK